MTSWWDLLQTETTLRWFRFQAQQPAKKFHCGNGPNSLVAHYSNSEQNVDPNNHHDSSRVESNCTKCSLSCSLEQGVSHVTLGRGRFSGFSLGGRGKISTGFEPAGFKENRNMFLGAVPLSPCPLNLQKAAEHFWGKYKGSLLVVAKGHTSRKGNMKRILNWQKWQKEDLWSVSSSNLLCEPMFLCSFVMKGPSRRSTVASLTRSFLTNVFSPCVLKVNRSAAETFSCSQFWLSHGEMTVFKTGISVFLFPDETNWMTDMAENCEKTRDMWALLQEAFPMFDSSNNSTSKCVQLCNRSFHFDAPAKN